MAFQFLGLGKTKYNSSICLLDDEHGDIEVFLTERLNRKKNSGAWPEIALLKILTSVDRDNLIVGENRDLIYPWVLEEIQNKLFPFYEYLKIKKLDFFLSKFNSNIKFISHHTAHAYAALAMSPFTKSIILVMDGAGTQVDTNKFEECTIYLQDGVNLNPVFKRNVSFEKSKRYHHHTFGNRIGAAYEKISEFVFNSPHSSGKVMGLASFGKTFQIDNVFSFLNNLKWENSFNGKEKNDWEELNHDNFKNLAATIQKQLEDDYSDIILEIRMKYSDYPNLILTGGCALNCTNNAKIYYQKIFENIFIPPFPGDECIGFGVAHYLKFQNDPTTWKPIPFKNQSAFFGSKESIPTDDIIEMEFSESEYEVKKCSDICKEVSVLLSDFKIIAWFQGRSESGPRALGNRSILVRPDYKGIKDILNKTIKCRENFRPYGCSVTHERAHIYFDIEEGFDNPYMSYAIKVRPDFMNVLKEVSHIDHTSRMQTVREGQNQKFYQLINAFGELTGLYCLLNTSLNIMDEPILETVSDAKRFLKNVPVDYLAIGNYLIRKNRVNI